MDDDNNSTKNKNKNKKRHENKHNYNYTSLNHRGNPDNPDNPGNLYDKLGVAIEERERSMFRRNLSSSPQVITLITL